MITAYELEQVRRRVEHLAVELEETRRGLDALEKRFSPPEREGGTQSAVAEAPPVVPPPLPPFEPHRHPDVEKPVASAEASVAAAIPAPLRAGDVSPEQPLPARSVATPAPPPSSSPSPKFAPAAVAGPSPLRVWLERLQLWPPSAEGEEGAEARLGAWWATRVGMFLAVVGVVFFGIHISRHVPAWVKFVELLLVAGGVSALGLWLEKRLAAFGDVVFAGGLALFFFAAYAGHAVPAVRVFPELWMSVAAQLVAVSGIVAAALWRRSAMIATLAIGLGYVTALVSTHGGLEGCALGAGALLAAVSVGLKRARAWEGPSVLALLGAYAVFALGLYQVDAVGVARLSAATWPYLAGVAVLFFARDWRRRKADTSKAAPIEELWFQSANSSLALACGVWAALGWYRSGLEWFYGGAALLLAAGAWRRARQEGAGDFVSAVLLAKASGALTLTVIEVAGARDAAVALLVQAWVLAWTARRIDSKVLKTATGLVALVAIYFFAIHGLGVAPIWSAMAAKTVLFSLGLTALASEAGAWLVKDRETRGLIEAIAATVAVAGLLVAAMHWTPGDWEPTLILGLAVVFGVLAWLRKGAAPRWTALGLATAAQLWLWGMSSGKPVASTLEWNALIVVGATAAAALLTRSRTAAATAWALAVVGAVLTIFALFPAEWALAAATVLGVAFGIGVRMAPGRHLSWVATLAVALGTACWLGEGLDGDLAWIGCAALAAWVLPIWLRGRAETDAERRAEPLAETMQRVQVLCATLLSLRALAEVDHTGGLGLALAGAGIAVFALAFRPGVRSALAASWIFWCVAALVAGFGRAYPGWWSVTALLAWAPALAWVRIPERWKTELTGWRSHAGSVQVVLASLLGATVATEMFSGPGSVFAFAGVTLASALVARPGGVAAAKAAAGVLAAWLSVLVFGEIVSGKADGAGAGFAAVLTAAGVIAALPLWLVRGRGEAALCGRYAGGAAALGLVFFLFGVQRGELAPYATVGWGLTAITLFMAGLFLRTAPYRVIGLVGLTICLPRMFIVDLNSALHRIVAFIVLGLVLLWVGFSYHRFRHLVSDRETPSDPLPNK